MQQAFVGGLVDDAGMQHQVAHRPARQAEQAQQPVLHFRALGEQGEIALPPQQRLDPVDEQDRRLQGAAGLGDGLRGARHQPREADLALVLEQPDLRLVAERADPRRQLRRKLRQEGFGVDRLRRRAAVAAAVAVAAPVVQQQVELAGDVLTRLAEAIEQRARAARLGGEAGGDPRQVTVVLGQDVGLLVVEVLDPVLDPAQQGVGSGQPLGAGPLHQAAGGELVERLQGRAGADLGELAATHDQQQLDDELDLADAAARQLDVVGALRPAGGATLRLVAHLGMQLAQALEHAVVEVAAVDEGGDQRPQRQRAPVLHAGHGRNHPALQPGEALPFAALDQEVVLQRVQRHRRGTGVAVGTQRQVDAEYEPSSVTSPIRGRGCRDLGEVTRGR